jgi:hypothetical protein
MALDIDTDVFRRSGHHVADAGSMLHFTPGTDVPACGSDQTSQAIMDNLNARQRWLNEHLQAGAAQAFNAAQGMDGTASAYQAQDQAAAATYGGGYAPAAAAPPASGTSMPAAPAPSAPPTLSAVPTISDQDGLQMATDLEGGAGTGPAMKAATHWSTIATRAEAANASLLSAQAQLLASGESQAHAPLQARLTRAIAWTHGVAGHAGALAGGYTTAADLHTTVRTAVGPSQDWSMRQERLKTYAAGGAVTRPLYVAASAEYTARQGEASAAAVGYQTGGTGVSTPPGTLPDPGLDPNTSGADSNDDPTTPTQPPGDQAKKDPAQQSGQQGDQQGGSGMQDILSSMMGALSPLLKAVSSPAQSLGQLAQQAGGLAGMGSKAAHAPIKAAGLSGAHAGGGAHGGGSPIKGAGLAGAVHPASLSGAPPSTVATGALKPAVSMPAAGASGGGAGMMPAGAGAGKGQNNTTKVNPAPAPLPDVEDIGRPGVVTGQHSTSAKPAPAVDPASKNAVKERLAARKKNLAGDDG